MSVTPLSSGRVTFVSPVTEGHTRDLELLNNSKDYNYSKIRDLYTNHTTNLSNNCPFQSKRKMDGQHNTY